MQIYYGLLFTNNDVTDICFTILRKDDIITIPAGDINRSHYFTDPAPGQVKHIFIEKDGVITKYDDITPITIHIDTNIICPNIPTTIFTPTPSALTTIHSTLEIKHGSFMDELPEQKIVVKYLTGEEKVLEIGGNIGRNSLVIASILKSSKNLVVLESHAAIAMQLTENRDLNRFEFHIESSALSKRKLIQKDWNTQPSEVLLPEYEWVSTITLEDLRAKYKIDFDTLVLDCEGAFYYILMDMPEILDNIRLIIVENDYSDQSHNKYVDEVLVKNNFKRIYTQCLAERENFYEVWKRE
jgi:FkbM family methyltransferase